MRRSRPLAVDDFRALKPIADRNGLTAKQAIPSPMCVHFRGGRAAIDPAIYPDIEDFFADLTRVYQEEIAEFYAAGCRYLQIDDTNLPFLCDPALRDNVRKIGEDPDTLPQLYVRLMNDALRGKPADMVVGVHAPRQPCELLDRGRRLTTDRGNRVRRDERGLRSSCEYDLPRAGGFAPLRYLTGRKVAVLGLLTTKKPQLESKEELKRRISEAANFAPPAAASG